MIHRRHLLAGAAVSFVLAVPVMGRAAETQTFTQKAFDAAKAAGRPVLVEVTAPWCPTCKAQRPILSDLLSAPKFKDLAVFDVDFDSRKGVLKELGVRMQSTLIAYKGASERGRSTGDTDKASIARLLDKTL
ncbi:MAG TPA: thioredoxin family protein [Lichenihabitans sp.]|jgi:thiol-disulfide isomerase/thioredoxin|nr:thioredoxin family protein [Lichenihabitans sp.]